MRVAQVYGALGFGDAMRQTPLFRTRLASLIFEVGFDGIGMVTIFDLLASFQPQNLLAKTQRVRRLVPRSCCSERADFLAAFEKGHHDPHVFWIEIDPQRLADLPGRFAKHAAGIPHAVQADIGAHTVTEIAPNDGGVNRLQQH
ncbi:hypothetical protein LA03_10230 [Burkholderia gladioli]|nr:hypothetical protein LA03_10230 [Burkholderia gladioli]